MELLILVAVLALLGFAAQTWGDDSRPSEFETGDARYGIA